MPLQMDAALEEAYASAPADEFVLQTLEIQHPAFVDPDGGADSLRAAVNDKRAWDLKLEADAPMFAGATKTFEPIAVEVVGPEQDEASLGQMRLKIDNVPQIYMRHLTAAATMSTPIRVIYREYLLNHDPDTGIWSVASADGPAYRVAGLTMKAVDATMLVLEGVAGFVDALGQSAPTETFNRAHYPGCWQ